ncbi:MAG: amidohydrolase family protein [Actinomycetota bacterium]|nr:amidohydrolase family protein [Actinomycetota bacterium]
MTKVIPGPHPDPHPPKSFIPPPKACDAHCHIFGPASQFPFAKQRAYTPPDSGIDRFEELQERLGLSRAVFVQASCHGTDNSALLHAVRRGNGKYSGVAMIDDDTTDLEIRQLHEAGVRGIRFNFVAHLGGAPDLDTYWRLIKRIVPLGWHVALHFDAKDLPNYAQMLDQMPVPYLIDHMARIRVEDGLEQEPFQTLLAMLSDERAWVKLSGVERITASGSPPYGDVVPYIRALIATAPDRVLWGTDWPHPNVQHMPDDGDLVDLLAAFAADDSVYSRILVENPERLYPFS